MAEETLEEYEARHRAEWGKYVATERIVIDGALAFLPGQPVPAGHVDRKDNPPVDKSQVARVDTKAAQAAIQEG